MTVLLHLLLLALSMSVIWVLSGILVSATDRVARRYRKPGFVLAFIILGLMTSIGEVAVAFNATIAGVPQVSAGNLVGSILVLFLFIIPVLALLGNGITMNGTLGTKTFVFLLLLALLPSLVALDGTVSFAEGAFIILVYVTLMYVAQKRRPSMEIIEKTVHQVEDELLHTRGFFFRKKATAIDITKITVAGIAIFAAGNLLVHESLYFAALLSVPASLIGLLVLSIGTNVPELVIAIRCVVGEHKDIAFGDYMGSAAANAFIMGFLVVANGTFAVERSEFTPTFILLAAGLVLFFIFSRTQHLLSRREAIVLLLLYAAFLGSQFLNVARFMSA